MRLRALLFRFDEDDDDCVCDGSAAAKFSFFHGHADPSQWCGSAVTLYACDTGTVLPTYTAYVSNAEATASDEAADMTCHTSDASTSTGSTDAARDDTLLDEQGDAGTGSSECGFVVANSTVWRTSNSENCGSSIYENCGKATYLNIR